MRSREFHRVVSEGGTWFAFFFLNIYIECTTRQYQQADISYSTCSEERRWTHLFLFFFHRLSEFAGLIAVSAFECGGFVRAHYPTFIFQLCIPLCLLFASKC